MPREEEIPAAAAARSGLAPVHTAQVTDQVISIDDVVSQSTSARAQSSTRRVVPAAPPTMSGKDELLALLRLLDLADQMESNSPGHPSVPTASGKLDSVANIPLSDVPYDALKVIASDFDQLHLLTGEELAHYKKYIFAAQQDYQNLLAESHKKALYGALREKKDLEKKKEDLEWRNKALSKDNAALSKRVEVVAEQSAKWEKLEEYLRPLLAADRKRVLEDQQKTQTLLEGNAGKEASPEKEKVVKRKKPSDVLPQTWDEAKTQKRMTRAFTVYTNQHQHDFTNRTRNP